MCHVIYYCIVAYEVTTANKKIGPVVIGVAVALSLLIVIIIIVAYLIFRYKMVGNLKAITKNVYPCISVKFYGFILI